MAEQTLVAVYDTPAHADAAVRALEAANVPSDAISRHAQEGSSGSTAAPVQERGFWSSLFGGDTDDSDVYGRSVAGGSTVVTVRVPEQYAARVNEILEAHDPIDIDERAATYGTQTTTSTTSTTAATGMAAGAGMASAARTSTAATGDDTIKVVAEELSVGKRAVNRGGARVRSYVVETPVEEQVTLRDETVRVERRPVDRPATAADIDAFREGTIEARETREEAVVSKDARVVEEISLRKEATERVETVRDTVRRTEVDVEDTTGTTGTTRTGATGTTTGMGTGAGSTVDRTLNTNVSGTNPGADTPDGTAGNPPGTMASRAVDKTLGTNISGANPGGENLASDTPDGTPGNPPGTMASRGVDKTLGTNISGANPGGRKS